MIYNPSKYNSCFEVIIEIIAEILSVIEVKWGDPVFENSFLSGGLQILGFDLNLDNLLLLGLSGSQSGAEIKDVCTK